MAIINCPECQNQISDTAKSCPHCGYKLNKVKALEEKGYRNHNEILFTIIGIALIFDILISGFFAYGHYYYGSNITIGMLNDENLWPASYYHLLRVVDIEFLAFILITLICIIIISSWAYSYSEKLKGKKNIINLVCISIFIIIFSIGIVLGLSHYPTIGEGHIFTFEGFRLLFYVDILLILTALITSILELCDIYIIKTAKKQTVDIISTNEPVEPEQLIVDNQDNKE